MRYEGRCHCGAIGYTYETALAPARWSVRACQCTFCRAHGASTTSDPEGSVEFLIEQAQRLRRYRFGHRITEFLICTDCGVYIGASMSVGGALRATVNTNVLRPPPAALPPPTPAAYEEESVNERVRRRERTWSMCRGILMRG